MLYNDAFDVAIRWHHSANVDSKATRDGRAHLIPVQNLTLDLAGLGHVLS